MRIDHGLVARLERTAAALALEHARAALEQDPETPAAGVPFGHGALVAGGQDRYVNRAIGVTLAELAPSDVHRIEEFYVERGLDPSIELSAWAPSSTVDALRAGGYGLDWFRAMFARSPADTPSRSVSDVVIAEVTDDTEAAWLDVLAVGNGITDRNRRAISDEHALVQRTAGGSTNFVALLDGRVVGCGSLQVHDGVAWVGGAATHPDARELGVQSALLLHRIELAAAAGCELIAGTAVPSGGSARNLSRLGFAHVQTQVVLTQRSGT